MNNTQNTSQKEYYFLNHFHALNSLEVSKKKDTINSKVTTEDLITVFSCYDKTADKEWLEGIIESALHEKDEAKQIYELAEDIRIFYIETTIGDVDKIHELIDNFIVKDKQYRLYVIMDYLMHLLYSIDLFDVAKELILRYKNHSLFDEENPLSK